MKALMLAALCGLTVTALAHHSRIQYDMTNQQEMRGEIINVRWRNPHVTYTLLVTNDAGDKQEWFLEAGSIYMLARTGVNENKLKVGDQVRVAGYPSSRGDTEFYLTNVLLPDGNEVVMLPMAQPYWEDDALGGRDQWKATLADSENRPQGIYRVWSIEALQRRLTGSGLGELPLTASARAKKAKFDPLKDDPALDCIKPGMPRTMRGPHPIQFVNQGDTIEIQIAEFDIRRTVSINDTRDPASIPLSKQGFSRGKWMNGILQVETSRVDWPFFDGVGTPLSTAVEIYERFALSEDGSRLNYEVTVTDPNTFTEPVSISTYWLDLGEPMEIYNCVADD
jgi:hypothetical protein